MSSEKERRNLDRAVQWIGLRVEDAQQKSGEFYAPSCVIQNMLTGRVLRGREDLLKFEQSIQALDSSPVKITRAIANDDKVALQIDVIHDGRTAKSCAFLTFDDAGLTLSVNWYGEDAAGFPAAFQRSA